MLGVQALGPVVPRQVAECRAANPSVSQGMPAETVAEASVGRAASRDRDLQTERDAWVALLTVPGLGPVTFASLLEAFGSAAAVLDLVSQPDGAARLREGVADHSADEDSLARPASRLGDDLARRISDHASDR